MTEGGEGGCGSTLLGRRLSFSFSSCVSLIFLIAQRPMYPYSPNDEMKIIQRGLLPTAFFLVPLLSQW